MTANSYLTQFLGHEVLFQRKPRAALTVLPLLILLLTDRLCFAQDSKNIDPATPFPVQLSARAAGSARVSNSGASTYAIKIAVPPGTAGAAPDLSFAYTSQSNDNDLLGVGWSITGLPTIERCARTIAQDGVRGGINYDAGDRFCLERKRLIAVSGAYGANGTEYRTEVDSGLKIVSFGTAGSGPSFFKVWKKSGELVEFGNTADSKVEAQGKTSVRLWALNKLQDSSGNYLTVTYTETSANGEYRVNRIDYTGNTAAGLSANRSVRFSYATRPDQVPMYQGGSLIKTTVRLTNVKTFVGATVVKDYRLTYNLSGATKRSRLASIQECTGAGTCLPANTFSWQNATNGTYQAGQHVIPVFNTYFNEGLTWAGDANGDGRTDLISYAWPANAFGTYFSNGDGTYQPVTYFLSATNFNYSYNRVWGGDFNGDSFTDLLNYNLGGTFTIFFSNGDGTYREVTFTPPLGGWDINYFWVADFDGDGRTDMRSYTGTLPHFRTFFSNGDGTFQQVDATVSASGTGWDADRVWVGDVDGDGLADLISYTGTSPHFRTFLSNPDGTFRQVDATVTASGSDWDANRVWVGDANGDGRSDLVSYYNSTPIQFSTFFSKGDGTYNRVDTAVTTSGDDWNAAQVWANDFNGDGRLDLRSYSNTFSPSANSSSYFTTFYFDGEGTYDKLYTDITANNTDWTVGLVSIVA